MIACKRLPNRRAYEVVAFEHGDIRYIAGRAAASCKTKGHDD
jgi:hypothetical protein